MVQRKSHHQFRRPSIKFLVDKCTEKAHIGSVQENNQDNERNIIVNSDVSNLFVPSIARKPSITFNETVSVFKSDGKNTSPCK